MTRVLITGGAGFMGSHIVRAWLARYPADEVVNLDALTYAGSRERLREVEGSSSYRFVQGDLCDAAVLRQVLRDCQIVVHLAAETHVDRSITDAVPFLRTNVDGTYRLLEQAAAAGVRKVLHVSTDEVYGPVLQGAVDEDAPLAPRSPYAASKAAGDLLAQSFRHTFGLPVTILRPTNVFGPWQLPEKFIPLCLTNAMDGLPLPLYGDGQQRRAWLYVDDFCEALMTVFERGATGEIYNVGSGHEQANLDTAKEILTLLEREEDLIQFVQDRPAHDRRYAMRDEKLRALGWRPRTAFRQGLQETIGWYRARADWWRPLVRTLREGAYHWLNRSAGSRPSAAARPKE